jgi:hypothetical protein
MGCIENIVATINGIICPSEVRAPAVVLRSSSKRKRKRRKKWKKTSKKNLKKFKKKLILEFSEMARTFIEKFLGQPLLGEK